MTTPLPPRAFAPMALPPLPETPLVSVIVPSYNYAAFLPAAVASVQAQTYPHWEMAICDDGSTDDTAAVLARLAAAEPRLRVVSKPNGGQASALNAAYAATSGPVVCILDADDLFEPAKLATVVEAFRAQPRAGLHAHAVQQVDAAGQRYGRTAIYTDLVGGWRGHEAVGNGSLLLLPPASALSLRREVADRLFPIDETLRRAADGHVQLCAPLLTEIAVSPAPLTQYRLHGGNLSGVTGETPDNLARTLADLQALGNAQRAFVERAWEGAVVLAPLEQSPAYLETEAKRLALSGAPWRQRTALLRRLGRQEQAPVAKSLRVAARLPPPVDRLLLTLVYGATPLKAVFRWVRRRLP